MIRYATTMKGIKQALYPNPLEMDELPDFFEETTAARDPHLSRRYVMAQDLESDDNVKVLLFGHTGCGKSTELTKLQEEQEKRFCFINLNVQKEVQPSQVSIENLLVLIVEAVVRQSKERLGLELNEHTLKNIYEWFREAFDIKEDDLRYGLETGADASTKNTVWGRFLGLGAYLRADIKAGSHSIHRTITRENRRLTELSHQCNLLIKEGCIGAKKKDRQLVLIVENLDKTPIAVAEEIFIHNPAPLADLACKCIFTAPIWLLCNPRSTTLDAPFRRTTLPMIKVTDIKGNPCTEGRDVIKAMLRRRMDVASLVDGAEDGEAIELAIVKTGGVLRHLFDVLVTAAATTDYAVMQGRREDAVILKEDVRYGLDQLKSELVRRLGVVGLPEEYQKAKISTQDMLNHLRKLVKHPRRLDSDLVNLLLLEAHAVIEYNGEGWHAAHPLIAEYISEAL